MRGTPALAGVIWLPEDEEFDSVDNIGNNGGEDDDNEVGEDDDDEGNEDGSCGREESDDDSDASSSIEDTRKGNDNGPVTRASRRKGRI